MTTSAFVQAIFGLAVVYLLASMLASGLREIVARLFNERGKLLRDNLLSILPDRWVYQRVINHPLVACLYRGTPGQSALPSYIPPRSFANALLDVLMRRLQSDGGKPVKFDLNGVRKAVANAKEADLAVGHALAPLVARAGTMEEVLANVEQSFNSSVERIGGWYKARTQKMLFFLGLAIAAAANLDTIQIVSSLAQSENLRTVVAASGERLASAGAPDADAAQRARTELGRLADAGLPIGYACIGSAARPSTPGAGTLTALGDRCGSQAAQLGLGDLAIKVFGWLLTALAVSLGAPFWFDLIGRAVNLRSSGTKPEVRTPPAVQG